MTETQALMLFKCLSDRSRLQILKSLALEDMYVERLAERLGLTPPTISFHLKKLADAGAVKSYKTQYYTMYALEKSVFMTSILDLIQEKSDEAELQKQRDEAYRKKVIDTFFEYGNIILADFHDDFCTLRRDMIGEKLLARDHQIYWRIDSNN